uniref:Uncharacterized protein n=1 Tax=Chromera velia CCMP2878 TaxID=1169474 RepID=A0A0G4HUJ0_9ALVE|eukprot:Cvel_31862.t1-p1 / transcript=Cvel_31862.t1 / gene=Cvel_31862 / organism=Chromera_velia_CCMP2878 / gene_product=hypothetical protein / transcript_product=hypothetical protein / location=Cvel_scaffold4827:1664-4684(-) / protein_length=1007 / sequence_SO=supercontig / SO=protein_coding / is_pseudo=false
MESSATVSSSLSALHQSLQLLYALLGVAFEELSVSELALGTVNSEMAQAIVDMETKIPLRLRRNPKETAASSQSDGGTNKKKEKEGGESRIDALLNKARKAIVLSELENEKEKSRNDDRAETPLAEKDTVDGQTETQKTETEDLPSSSPSPPPAVSRTTGGLSRSSSLALSSQHQTLTKEKQTSADRARQHAPPAPPLPLHAAGRPSVPRTAGGGRGKLRRQDFGVPAAQRGRGGGGLPSVRAAGAGARLYSLSSPSPPASSSAAVGTRLNRLTGGTNSGGVQGGQVAGGGGGAGKGTRRQTESAVSAEEVGERGQKGGDVRPSPEANGGMGGKGVEREREKGCTKGKEVFGEGETERKGTEKKCEKEKEREEQPSELRRVSQFSKFCQPSKLTSLRSSETAVLRRFGARRDALCAALRALYTEWSSLPSSSSSSSFAAEEQGALGGEQNEKIAGGSQQSVAVQRVQQLLGSLCDECGAAIRGWRDLEGSFEEEEKGEGVGGERGKQKDRSQTTFPCSNADRESSGVVAREGKSACACLLTLRLGEGSVRLLSLCRQALSLGTQLRVAVSASVSESTSSSATSPGQARASGWCQRGGGEASGEVCRGGGDMSSLCRTNKGEGGDEGIPVLRFRFLPFLMDLFGASPSLWAASGWARMVGVASVEMPSVASEALGGQGGIQSGHSRSLFVRPLFCLSSSEGGVQTTFGEGGGEGVDVSVQNVKGRGVVVGQSECRGEGRRRERDRKSPGLGERPAWDDGRSRRRGCRGEGVGGPFVWDPVGVSRLWDLSSSLSFGSSSSVLPFSSSSSAHVQVGGGQRQRQQKRRDGEAFLEDARGLTASLHRYQRVRLRQLVLRQARKCLEILAQTLERERESADRGDRGSVRGGGGAVSMQQKDKHRSLLHVYRALEFIVRRGSDEMPYRWRKAGGDGGKGGGNTVAAEKRSESPPQKAACRGHSQDPFCPVKETGKEKGQRGDRVVEERMSDEEGGEGSDSDKVPRRTLCRLWGQ